MMVNQQILAASTVLNEIPQLTRINLPGGRVCFTQCPQSQLGEVQSHIARLSHASEILRIIPLGDLQRHPISWLWTRQPRLAACLPDAFACVLIVVRELQESLRDAAKLRRVILGLDSRVDVLQELKRVEPPKFLPAFVPPHQEADAALKSAVEIVSAGSDGTVSLAVQAGLLLMNDCLNESHSCSQAIEGEERSGDYWHAIMHRREPDYGNAKYWFRQVGKHPVFERLPGIAARIIKDRKVDNFEKLTAPKWDPLHFVDLCERHARNENSPEALALREIQGWEMALLLDASAHD